MTLPAILLSELLFVAPTVLAANECQPTKWKRAEPGEVTCRYWAKTESEVNYFSCTDLSNRYVVLLADFFKLNPGLKTDCSNIQPNTKYCVDGCKSCWPSFSGL